MPIQKGYGDNLFIYTGAAYGRNGADCRIIRRTNDGEKVVVKFRDGLEAIAKRSHLEQKREV